MHINNINSTNFNGIKYQYHDVVNTYFNYRLKQGGRSSISKMGKLLESQQNNPFHVVLSYMGDDKTIKEFAVVNGKEFVRRRFEPMINLIKRSVKYANKLNKEGKEKPLALDGLKDFELKA
ncbi:MAG: hypothetical protein E7Z92_05250 [Cyanobacteria bacterium SIG31]|nr:hypothetical protein [Cyanobacteria bacterium SIG31]